MERLMQWRSSRMKVTTMADSVNFNADEDDLSSWEIINLSDEDPEGLKDDSSHEQRRRNSVSVRTCDDGHGDGKELKDPSLDDELCGYNDDDDKDDEQHGSDDSSDDDERYGLEDSNSDSERYGADDSDSDDDDDDDDDDDEQHGSGDWNSERCGSDDSVDASMGGHENELKENGLPGDVITQLDNTALKEHQEGLWSTYSPGSPGLGSFGYGYWSYDEWWSSDAFNEFGGSDDDDGYDFYDLLVPFDARKTLGKQRLRKMEKKNYTKMKKSKRMTGCCCCGKNVPHSGSI